MSTTDCVREYQKALNRKTGDDGKRDRTPVNLPRPRLGKTLGSSLNDAPGAKPERSGACRGDNQEVTGGDV